MLANTTSDDHPPENKINNLQPAITNGDVRMEKNQAYAETEFK